MAKEEVRKQFRLADLLRTEISELATHDPIPSERALAERFGTSRVTIRQALALLQDDGLIYTVHGAGSFVAPPRVVKQMRLLSFTEEMKQKGLRPSTKLISAKLIEDDENAVDDFVVVSEPAYRIERLRLGNLEPLSLEITYVNQTVAPNLLDHDLTKSLYHILESKYGQEVFSADEHLTPIIVDKEIAKIMKIPVGSAAIRIQRTGYNVRGEEVERSISIRQGNRWDFKYSIRI
jgi:GntR family transcriptional regulator